MILPDTARIQSCVRYFTTLDPIPESAAIRKLNLSCWILAVVCYGVIDVVLTAYFIETASAVEQHPIAAVAIERIGLWTLVLLKTIAIAAAYAAYRKLPNPYASGFPVGLLVLGMFLTGWNMAVVLTA